MKKLFLETIRDNPVKIGHLLGYDKLTDLHNDWIKKFLFNSTDYTLQAHRGSYKTTALIVALTLLMIIKPNDNIMFMRKTDDDVKSIVKAIIKALESDVFASLVKNIYDMELKIITKTAFNITTNLVSFDRGTAQLTAIGSGGSLTGKHFERIFTDDICFVAGTKVATPFGDKNIESLKVGDLVLTPIGYKRILNTSCHFSEVIKNINLIGTINHPVYNKHSNKFDFLIDSCCNNLSIINLKDLIKWRIAKILSNGMVENGKKQVENIISYGQNINIGLVKCFIEQYGKVTMGKFPKAMLSIIKTIIQIITILIIWNVYQLGNIKECICLNVQNGVKKILRQMLDLPCLNGANQKLDNQFLKQEVNPLQSNLMKIIQKMLFAQNATKNIDVIKKQGLGYVEDAVSLQPIKDTMIRLCKVKNLATLKSLVMNVEVFIKQILQNVIKMDYAKTVQAVNIIEKKKQYLVYNIEVEDINVYYANKILVHNCNLKDRVSTAERDRVKQIYMELQNLRNRGGTILNCGTPWHRDDCFTLMPEPEIYSCYDSGLMTIEEINTLRQSKSMTPTLFAANYELKHIVDENALFKNPRFTNNTSSIYNGICHIDAAFGGKDTTAFTIFKKLDDGTLIGYGKIWHKHIEDCVNEILELRNRYKAGTCHLETNADKGFVAKMLTNRGIENQTYHESMNKHLKIHSHLYKNWDNIKWIDETDSEYLNQILDYEEGQGFDDACDSAASTCKILEGDNIFCIAL